MIFAKNYKQGARLQDMERPTYNNDLKLSGTPSAITNKLEFIMPTTALVSAPGPVQNGPPPQYPLTEDPMTFVDIYSSHHNLPEEPGHTLAEKSCQIRAADARDEYKRLLRRKEESLHSSGVPSDNNMDGVQRKHEKLSGAEKHIRRLKNNRRSAHASKVYSEVLRREISSMLHRRSHELKSKCQSCSEDVQKNFLAEDGLVLFHLRNQVAQLTMQCDQLKKELQEAESARFAAEQRAAEVRATCPLSGVQR